MDHGRIYQADSRDCKTAMISPMDPQWNLLHKSEMRLVKQSLVSEIIVVLRCDSANQSIAEELTVAP